MALLALLAGRAEAASYTVTTNSNWSTAAAFTSTPNGADTVIVANGATLTIDVNTAVCGVLTLGASTPTNGTISFNAGQQLTVGTLNLGAGAGTGSVNMTAGGTLVVNLIAVVAAGTWTPGVGLVKLNATNPLPASAVTSFYDLEVASGTTTLGANTTVSHVLTIDNAATLDASSRTLTLSGTGTPLVKTGTFTASTSTVNYTGAAAGVTVAAATYNTLGIRPVSDVGAANTISSGGAITVGNLTIGNAASTNTVTFDASANAGTLTVAGTVTIAAKGALIAPTSNVTVGGAWVNAGTFTHNSGTITLTSTVGGRSLTSGGSAFYNLGITGVGGGWVALDALTVANNYTQTAGTLTAPATTMTVGGTFNNNGGTFSHNNGSVLLTSTASQTLTNKNGGGLAQAFYNLTIDDSSVAGYWPLDEATAGSTVADVSGNGQAGTPIGTGGANNLPQPSSTSLPTLAFPDANALAYDGTDDAVIVSSHASVDLTTYTVSLWCKQSNNGNRRTFIADQRLNNGPYGVCFLIAEDPTGATYMHMDTDQSNYYIAGANVDDNAWHHLLGTVGGGSMSFYVDGALQGGAPTAYAGTVQTWMPSPLVIGAEWADGNFAANICDGLVDDVHVWSRVLSAAEIAALAAGGAPHTVTLANALTVAHDFQLGDAGLDVSASNFAVTVAGAWKNSGGVLIPHTGTVTLNGTSQTIVGSTSFYNLTKSVAAAATLTLPAGLNQTINGTLTLNGASGQLLSLVSSTPGTPALITPNGTRTCSFLSVTDQTNTLLPNIDPASSTSVSGNTNWFGPKLAANTGLTLASGCSATITTAKLQATDPNYAAASLTYTLTAAPAHGLLRRNLVQVAASGTFTQADIDANLISYEDGDIASPADSFQVTVTDPDGATTGAVTVNVTVSGTGLSTGLVGYWPFEEGSGATAADRSGNGFPATLTGSPTWVAGQFGTALSLDGSTQYAQITRPIADDFSIVLWLRTSMTGLGGLGGWWGFSTGLIDSEVASTNSGFGIALANGGWIRAGTRDATGTSSTTFSSGSGSLNNNAWHMVSLTRVEATPLLSLQLDAGTATTTNAASTASLTASGTLQFGRVQSQGNLFNGKLDDIRMYSRALTTTEISALYAATADAAPAIANLSGDSTPLAAANTPYPLDVGGDATVTDADDLCLAGGALVVENLSGAATVTLAIAATGGITVAGSTVSSGGSAIGTIDATLDGTAGKNLLVRFDTVAATPAAASALVRALTMADSVTTTTRAIRVSVGDGLQLSAACVVPIYTGIVQDANAGVTVASGGAVTVTTAALQFHQTGSTTSQVTYTLTTPPAHGALRRNLVPIATSGTFTQADIDGNLISYEHGDLANGSDSLALTVTAQGATSASATVDVTVGGTGLVNGLVAYWPFEQTSGTSVPDAAGAYTGTVIGAPSWTAGQVGNALTFDGSTTYVTLPSGMADFTGGMTVSLWARPTSSPSYARFIDFGNNSASDNIVYARSSTSATNSYLDLFKGGAGVAVAGTNQLTNNAWHHYVWTLTGATSRIYTDGTPVGGTLTNQTLNNLARTRNFIGKSNWIGDGLYAGAMDEIRIYNRPLSDAEVKLLAAQAAPTIGNLNGDAPTYAGGAPVALDVGGDATFTDADDLFEAGGWLQVDNVAGTANSTLSIAAAGLITTAGSTVSYNGNAIGTVDATLDGTLGKGLKVAFTTVSATPTAVQALIQAIRFADAAPTPLTRTFRFSVNDGLCTPAPAVVTMTEDGPLTVSTDTGIAVAAGGVVTITNAMLAATDIGQTTAQMTFTLQTAPGHGFVRRNAALVAAAGTFTQADIDNGLVSYEHGDVASLSDSFAVSVADTIGNATGSVAVAVTATGTGLGTGLVAYWPLDDGSGSAALDRSGNNRSITLVNSPTWTAGEAGGGLTFAGASSQYGTFTRPIQDDYSILLWFKSNATGAGSSGGPWNTGSGLLDGEVGGVTNDFGLSYASTGFIQTAVGNSQSGADLTIQSGGGANDNAWHQIAVTRSKAGHTLTLQVDNGAAISSPSASTASLTAPASLALGRIQTGSNYFTGSMDDIRLFDHVLTADEITALYRGVPTDAAPVIGNLAGDVAVITAANVATAIDAGGDATVGDADDLCFAGGWLMIGNNVAGTSSVVSVATAGGISVAGSTVSYAGNAIGTIDATLTGASGKNLKIGFTTRYADATAVAALVHALRYTYTGAATAARFMRVILSDGVLTSVECDPYQVIDTGVTVASGGSVTIESSSLSAAQPSSSTSQVVYTLTTAPAHGFLRLNLAALAVGGTFTEADVENCLVSYEHGDIASGSDSFVLSISGASGQIASGVTVPVTVAGTGLANGLQAWWRLDETAGTTAADSAGANTGTLTNIGGGSWTTGQVLGGLAFASASSQYVNVPSSVPLGTTFSVMAWAKRATAGATQCIVNHTNNVGGTDNAMSFYFNSTNTIRFGLGNDFVETTATYADTTAAHHVVSTFSNKTVAIYYDGSAVATTAGATTGNYTGGAAPVHVGYSVANGGTYFNGWLDEVRLYNRVLTPGEIRLVYQQAAPAIANLGGDSTPWYVAAGPVLIDSGAAAAVSDGDDLCFAGGYAQVALTNRSGTDVLAIFATGGITQAGNVVSYGGNRIGTVDATLDGSVGHDLKVAFDTRYATPTAVAALLHAITYDNADATANTTTRSIAVTLNDNTFTSATATVSITIVTSGGTATWDGGGSSDNWSDPLNWVGDTLPLPLDDLVFTGVVRQTPVNDRTNLAGNPWTAGSITLAGGFALSGNALVLRGGLIDSGGANSVADALTLGQAQSFACASGGALTVSGTIANAGYLLTIGGAGDVALGDVISGGGGLTAAGTGTLTLSANNTYTGPTTITAGTTVVNGSQPSSAVAVNGGTLSGTGTVGAISGTAGSVSPGTVGARGTLHAASADLSGGLALSVRIVGYATPGTDYDQLDLATAGGALTLNGRSSIVVDAGGVAAPGFASQIVTMNGAAGGQFGSVTANNLPAGWTIIAHYSTPGTFGIGLTLRRRGNVVAGAPGIE